MIGFDLIPLTIILPLLGAKPDLFDLPRDAMLPLQDSLDLPTREWPATLFITADLKTSLPRRQGRRFAVF